MKNLMEEDYQKALLFAARKHEGQFRIGGEKYISHPVAVAELLEEKGFGIPYRIAGLFHDLLEDTDATEEEILALSSPEVLEAVRLLTKEKGYIMKEYVEKIKGNEMAFAVKTADRLHNLRCAVKADEAFRRKYILETIDWYWEFSPEIQEATKRLAKTLSEPIKNYPLLYESNLTLRAQGK